MEKYIINNTTYTLTQAPYLDSNDDLNYYTAQAANADGDTVTLYWPLRDGFDPSTSDDESNACDWGKAWLSPVNRAETPDAILAI